MKSSHNQPEFTVSEISARLKSTVEEAFSYVRVRGEISGFKRAASGHLYFSLKDENAVLNGICWKGVAGKLAFKPEDGLEVICVGKISTYPGRSNYQILCEWMEPAGVGALMALLEARKKALAAEGLFDPARKKPLPFLPKVIGVVTSPTGAVIRDILHRLSDRFPVHVLVWPVLVQGEGAAEQVAAAIEGFNKLGFRSQVSGAGKIAETWNLEPGTLPRPDLLIVARGGGSLEDLWAFNEEIVVRAAASSEIPLISAVGHETDTTLIDFASDRRAPTPTAAAEMAVPVRAELRALILDIERRLFSGTMHLLAQRQNYLAALARGLTSPKQLLENMAQRLDDWSERLSGSLPKLLEKKTHALHLALARLTPASLLHQIALHTQRIGNLGRLLESYHYKKVLARGFALVRDSKNAVITTAKAIAPGAALSLEFADGSVGATADGGASPSSTSANPAATQPRKKPDSTGSGSQGSLF